LYLSAFSASASALQSDFYLQDGNTHVFVNGSKAGTCKVDGQLDVSGTAFGSLMLCSALAHHKLHL
jgi:hypothetical protein